MVDGQEEAPDRSLDFDDTFRRCFGPMLGAGGLAAAATGHDDHPLPTPSSTSTSEVVHHQRGTSPGRVPVTVTTAVKPTPTTVHNEPGDDNGHDAVDNDGSRVVTAPSPPTTGHVEPGDDHGRDAADHDANDDRAADNVRRGDDHGGRGPGNGRDNPAGHDANDDHGGRG